MFDKYVRAALFFFGASLIASPRVFADTCSYETWEWNSIQRKAINRRKIVKQKFELTKEERGEIQGCSICEEDQIEVHLNSLPPFKVCKLFQDRITRAVRKAASEGFQISSIVAYRVGKTKGPLNSAGQRTQFSNHSYGTAIDFNSEKNGLYDSCIQFGPQCKLIRGGNYRQELPGAVTKTSALYKSMLTEGFKWGGEIVGKQKDFMHFSLNGM